MDVPDVENRSRRRRAAETGHGAPTHLHAVEEVLHVLEGEADIAEATLARRDSIALEGEDKIEIAVRANGTDMLLVETKL